MRDRHGLDPFIVQEAKSPRAFQRTAGTMQQGWKKRKNPTQREKAKTQIQEQVQSKKPVII